MSAKDMETILEFSGINLQKMKDMLNQFKSQMRLQQEPIKELSRIIALLKEIVSNQSEVLSENGDFFFKDFISGFAQTLAQLIKIKLTKPEFGELIKTIPELLGKIFVNNVENIELVDSLKYVFDAKSRIYQYHMLSDENSILIDNSVNSMPAEEKSWREALQVGDKIEAIKIDPEQKGARCWSKATVKERNELRIKVSFDRDSKMSDREISIYSKEMSREKLEDADAWRNSLKAGDNIDCFDSTGYWYASTVLAVEQREYQKEMIDMVQIAFRISHPDGDKKDQDGTNFFGWDKEYDEWVPLFSARLASFKEHTEGFENQTSSAQNTNSTKNAAPDTKVDDQMDMLVENKDIYAVQRKQCRSDLLVAFINTIGQNGGFQKMLDQISKADLILVHGYVNCIGKCAANYHRKFVEEYFPQFEQAIKEKIMAATETELRNVKKELLDEILEQLYKGILTRLNSRDQIELNSERNLFTIELGELFMRQNFIQGRIDGVRLISEVCKNCLTILASKPSTLQANGTIMHEKKLNMVDQVAQKIHRTSNIMVEIFSKNRTHSQLVQRSEKIIGLMMTKNLFSQEDQETVWNASEINDGDLRIEIHKLLTGAANQMETSHRLYFLTKISSVPEEDLNDRHIELISEICSTIKDPSQDPESINLGLKILWKIATESQAGMFIINRATNGFSGILSKQQCGQKLDYIDKLAQNIKQKKKMGYLTIKILSNVLKSSFEGGSEIKNQNDAVDYLEKKHNLQQGLFDEFQEYMSRVRAEIEEKGLRGKEIFNRAVVDLFMHEDQVTERLEFIKFYSNIQSSVRLNFANLKILWTELVSKTLDDNDSKLMYIWLREVCDQLMQKDGSSKISIDDMIKFYHETMDIQSNEADEFKWLSIQGFQCIQSFFVLINSVQKKLLKITPEHGIYKVNQEIQTGVMKNATKKFTSFNNVTGAKYTSYTFSNTGETQKEPCKEVGPQNIKKDEEDPNDLEIQSLVPPTELDGYNIIWRIATESTSKLVIDSAAKLLIQMHHEVTESLKSKIPSFDDDFIDQCFKIIDNQRPEIDKRSPEQTQEMYDRVKCLPIHATTIQKLRVFPVQERKIIRSLFLLRQLIRASEKTGTHSLKPHLSLRQGVFLGCIQVQNNISGDKDGYLKRLEVGIDSHATVWDLKKLIGEEVMKSETDATLPSTPVHPASIRIFQMSTSQDLTDPRNGATLSELKIKQNENIGAFRKRIDLQRRAPIVEEVEGKVHLTTRAKQVAKEILNMFADVQIEGEMKMTNQAANKFYKKWIGSGVKGTLVDQQSELFKTMLLSSKVDGDEQSSEELKLSLDQWEQFMINLCIDGHDDILRLGFKNLGYAQDLSRLPQDGDDDNILQIRKTKEQMPRYKVANNEKQFDTLLRLLDMHREVEQRSIEMIQMLITNPKLYDSVLMLNDQDFKWSKIFDYTNEHKMLYSLEIVEAILVRDQPKQTTQKWLQKFIELKGFEELQNMLINALQDVHSCLKSKKYVEQLFKIIRLLVIGSQENEQEVKVQVEESVPEQKDDDKEDDYTTPKKQIKHHTDIVSTFDGQITKEFLFGGADEETEAPKVKPPPKKELTVPEQKDDHLQKVLQSSGLGKAILERANIASLQDQVVKVVGLFLKEDEIKLDDRLIIESAMSLWSALLSNSVSDVPITIDPEFLKIGILQCMDIKVRECFGKTFKVISKAQIQLNEQLLDILKQQLKTISQYEKTSEYFMLFDSILSQYLKNSQNEKHLGCIIETLKSHKTKESRQSHIVDTTLQGLFQLLFTYITSCKTIKKVIIESFDESKLIDEIFSECLFSNHESDSDNKCTSQSSRKAAFLVLECYVALLEPHQMVEFIQKYIKPLTKDVERPKKWRHSPSSKGRINDHVGIVNLGCICYMNSMLQQFFMVPQFRYQLLKAVDKNPENFVEYKDDMIDDNLLKQLQKLFGFLELSERHAFNPKEFCFAFKDFDGTPTKISEQKDSQEFLNIFVERIEHLLKNTSQKDLMRDVFSGNQCSQLICQSCGKVKNRMELFYNLSLQVKDCSGIYDSLGKLAKGQTIEDYHCEGCNKKVNVTKRSLLANMPNVLIVHLQRIIFCFDTLMNDKVNSRFEFPNVLDLRQFSFKESMKDKESAENEEEDEIEKLMNIDDDDYIYRLVGVNIHVGTADHGHYYSIINTKRGAKEQDPYQNEEVWKKVELDPWKVFDDQHIRSFGFNLDLKKEAFGGDQSSNTAATSDAMDDKELTSFLASGSQTYGKSAYMLIYERKSKKDLHEFSEDGEELPEQKVIPFKQVEKSIPDWIKNKVLSDNKNFITDSQLFNEDFMNLMRAIFKTIGGDLVMTSHRYDYAYQKNFDLMKQESLQLANTILFDMLSYYDKNTAISYISQDVQSIITFCDSGTALKGGKHSICANFVQKLFIDDTCNHLLYIMFTCTDPIARNAIGHFTSKVLIRLIEIYSQVDPELRTTLDHVKEIQQIIDHFIERVFSSLKEKECMKAWMRLECFFQILYKVGTSSLTAIQMLLERSDIISDLIDFMLGNKSPRAQAEREVRTAMGGTFPPPFQSLYTLVSTLIRMTHTSSMDLESRLPTHRDFKLSEFESHKSYFLSQEAYIMLTKTEFLEKVIFDTKYIEIDEFSIALAHLCYKDLKFTRKIAKKVLKGISYSNNDDVYRLLVIVGQMASIKDEFQKTRLEYLFGFAFLMHVNNEGSIQYGKAITSKKNHEEVYQISSGLDARNHDDALLSLLWKYKGRMDSFTLTCLQSLGELLSSDVDIADYFSELPPPNYSTLRYTDWINPYLESQLEDAQKYKNATGSEDKIAKIIKVQQLFSKYDEFLATKKVEPSYIILETREEKQVKTMDIDDVLHLEVTQIACKWVESKPTGTGNLSLPDNSQMQPKECNEEVPQEEDEDTTIEAESDVCENLLFRVTLTNNHTQALRFKLSFTGTSDELLFPCGGIKDFIRPGITAHLVTIRRKSATAPLPDLGLILSLTYKIHPGNDFEMSQYASQSDRPKVQSVPKKQEEKRNLTEEIGEQIRSQRRGGISVSVDTYHESLVEPSKPDDDSPQSFAQKSCPACTLLNDFDATVCDCCGTIFS